MDDRLSDMNERLTDEFYYDGAEGEDEDEVRYGLTALGATQVEKRRSFAGFGPCSATHSSVAVTSASSEVPRRIRRARTRHTASLFG